MAPQYHFSGLNFFGHRLNGVAGPVNDHQKRHRVRIPHHFPSNCDECEKLFEKFDDEVDDVGDDNVDDDYFGAVMATSQHASNFFSYICSP